MFAANAAYVMGFTRDVLAALAIIGGAFLAVTLYAKLRPRFLLHVLPDWVGDRLILRLEIENTSSVYALVESAYLEVQEKTLERGSWLTHRVDFSKTPETVIFCRSSSDTAAERGTDRIYPGEVLTVGRIYDYPADGAVVQIGLQVKLRRRGFGLFPKHQQTTTRFVVKPADRAAA
jgi:hypothetical protein